MPFQVIQIMTHDLSKNLIGHASLKLHTRSNLNQSLCLQQFLFYVSPPCNCYSSSLKSVMSLDPCLPGKLQFNFQDTEHTLLIWLSTNYWPRHIVPFPLHSKQFSTSLTPLTLLVAYLTTACATLNCSFVQDFVHCWTVNSLDHYFSNFIVHKEL